MRYTKGAPKRIQEKNRTGNKKHTNPGLKKKIYIGSIQRGRKKAKKGEKEHKKQTSLSPKRLSAKHNHKRGTKGIQLRSNPLLVYNQQ